STSNTRKSTSRRALGPLLGAQLGRADRSLSRQFPLRQTSHEVMIAGFDTQQASLIGELGGVEGLSGDHQPGCIEPDGDPGVAALRLRLRRRDGIWRTVMVFGRWS